MLLLAGYIRCGARGVNSNVCASDSVKAGGTTTTTTTDEKAKQGREDNICFGKHCESGQRGDFTTKAPLSSNFISLQLNRSFIFGSEPRAASFICVWSFQSGEKRERAPGGGWGGREGWGGRRKKGNKIAFLIRFFTRSPVARYCGVVGEWNVVKREVL